MAKARVTGPWGGDHSPAQLRGPWPPSVRMAEDSLSPDWSGTLLAKCFFRLGQGKALASYTWLGMKKGNREPSETPR